MALINPNGPQAVGPPMSTLDVTSGKANVATARLGMAQQQMGIAAARIQAESAFDIEKLRSDTERLGLMLDRESRAEENRIGKYLAESAHQTNMATAQREMAIAQSGMKLTDEEIAKMREQRAITREMFDIEKTRLAEQDQMDRLRNSREWLNYLNIVTAAGNEGERRRLGIDAESRYFDQMQTQFGPIGGAPGGGGAGESPVMGVGLGGIKDFGGAGGAPGMGGEGGPQGMGGGQGLGGAPGGVMGAGGAQQTNPAIALSKGLNQDFTMLNNWYEMQEQKQTGLYESLKTQGLTGADGKAFADGVRLGSGNLPTNIQDFMANVNDMSMEQVADVFATSNTIVRAAQEYLGEPYLDNGRASDMGIIQLIAQDLDKYAAEEAAGPTAIEPVRGYADRGLSYGSTPPTRTLTKTTPQSVEDLVGSYKPELTGKELTKEADRLLERAKKIKPALDVYYQAKNLRDALWMANPEEFSQDKKIQNRVYTARMLANGSHPRVVYGYLDRITNGDAKQTAGIAKGLISEELAKTNLPSHMAARRAAQSEKIEAQYQRERDQFRVFQQRVQEMFGVVWMHGMKPTETAAQTEPPVSRLTPMQQRVREASSRRESVAAARLAAEEQERQRNTALWRTKEKQKADMGAAERRAAANEEWTKTLLGDEAQQVMQALMAGSAFK